MSLIEAVSVSKTFVNYRKLSAFRKEKQVVQAVRQVSFQMEQGEMVGLVGPNGAGKTTLLQMLSGIYLPDEGSIQIDGRRPEKDRKGYVARIGALFAGNSELFSHLTVRDSLEWNSRFWGVSRSQFEKRLHDLAEQLELVDTLDKMPGELSLGESMKLELVNVFLHEPDIVFLDEPTIGVDIVAKKAIRSFLLERNRKHKLTMVMTSHDEGDIRQVCQRILSMDGGGIAP